MKKIFATIISLAALVGCNTPVNETVVTTLCAPMEVALDGNSRAYDNNLEWAWAADDTIAALQAEGDMTVNTLTLKENGKFGTDNFVYATDAPAVFMFVYPAEALDMQTSTFKYIQTGVWTPLLIGYAYDATVGNIGQVVMEHQSAAFEIRVWEAGRQTRKKITAATITSTTSDFLNGASNYATVEGLDSDTVVFNLANGDYAFELSLTDAEGVIYNVAVPSMNFAVGKRTVLNVEWKAEPAKEATVSFLAYSSYNESDGDVIKNDALSGNTIYVKDVVVADAQATDVASVKLLLNGSERADITSGSATVSGLGYGAYNVSAKLTLKNGYTYTTPESVVYVTGIPYHADWRNADYSTWKYVNCADKGANVRIDCTSSRWGGYVVGGVISPVFGIPSGGLKVYTSVAASTQATDASESDRCYIKAGTQSSSTEMSGSYVNIYYNASGNTYPDTALVPLAEAIQLSTSNPCIVYSGETYKIPVIGTNLYTYFYQIKITYNQQ